MKSPPLLSHAQSVLLKVAGDEQKNAARNRSSTQTQFNSRAFAERVKAAIQGCWPETLQRMGIPAKLLDGRNHPCPACGGTDRFQFTVRGAGADYGRFACRGLDEQGGDGFKLVMHVFNLSFNDAVRVVAQALGITPDGCCEIPRYQLPTPKAATAAPSVDRTAKTQALFDSGQTLNLGNTAGRYLSGRGLSPDVWGNTQALGHIETLDYWYRNGDKPELLGRFPALLAQITKPDGTLAGLHRIYLQAYGGKLALRHDETGEPLGCKKILAAHDGALAGAACRLFPVGADGRLALTEGIETAIAVHQLTGLPVWACISAGGLRSVVLPDTVREVLIYGDNDLPDNQGRNAGKLAALAAGERFIKEGRKCRIYLPPVAGADWLDVLNQRQQKEGA